ncbi:MAG: extracellular elastinolytic metalloproteinase [Pseudonocardiales bacterium]|nr:extracellular elastinolytic metalloproteinase [Pseudonocardiales bacterium]
MQAVSPALGLRATAAPEFIPDPAVQVGSSGAHAVNLHQQHLGIPVFHSHVTVRFGPDGAIAETVGKVVSASPEERVAPAVSAADAVLVGARHVAAPDETELGERDQFGNPRIWASVDLAGYQPRALVSGGGRANRPLVFQAGPFAEPITAELTWFPQGAVLRLSWDLQFVLPDGGQRYRVIVDAEDRAILYCRQQTLRIAAQGNVFTTDASGSRSLVPFPVKIGSYPAPTPAGLPNAFPYDWVDLDSTSGNCASAAMSGGAPLSGDGTSGIMGFDPSDPTSDDQAVLNAFYFSSFMHDYFYLLGFREADGNFQNDTFGLGGTGSDPVQNVVFDVAVDGTANFGPTAEGIAPSCNLGIVTSTNRSTAFDASVVYHEYTHGVSTRMVGGRTNIHSLDDPQSRGMGEGWSDYIACMVLGTEVVGAWVVDDPRGIRSAPYDDDYPYKFDKLADRRFNGDEHNLGEVWCATLMSMTRAIGRDLAVQLVVDAMKLGPANPSFLDERDAILTALGNMLQAGALSPREHDAALTGIWQAFARFGMGPGARSDGAQLSGIVADFNPPVDLTVHRPRAKRR